MESISLSIIILIAACVIFTYAAVTMWRAMVTERDVRARKAHEVWQVINAAFDTDTTFNVWTDNVRSQLEGASISRPCHVRRDFCPTATAEECGDCGYSPANY